MNIQSFQKWLIQTTIFIIPLFFLPFTQDVFVTSKQYVLVISVSALLLSSLISIFRSKRIELSLQKSDVYLGVFLFICMLSAIFMSGNKIQAILSPVYGLVTIFSLIVLTLYIRSRNVSIQTPLLYSGFFISVLVLLFTLVQPFATTQLPSQLAFLKEASFTPLGSYLETLIYLGIVAIVSVGSLLYARLHEKQDDHESPWIHAIMIFVTICGVALSCLSVVKTPPLTPPVQISWDAALHTLQTPSQMLAGVGIDNYATAFTLAKKASYNSLPFWKDNFRTASSTYLFMWTESGIISLLVFLYWLGITGAAALKKRKALYVVVPGLITIVGIGFITPVTFTWMFLLFALIGSGGVDRKIPFEKDLSSTSALIIALIGAISISAGIFMFGKAYAAEAWYKQALLNTSSASRLYTYHRKAIASNPYIERFRVSYSQVNLLIANSIARKKSPTAAEKQTITQTIQQAISEAKAAVQLNPQRPSNWANLALIYKSIVGVAKGADVWAISSYQRAIILDPMNPALRFNLGGVYYTLKKYPQAVQAFKQSIQLKSTIPNYHYNLAWAYYQNKDYTNAVNEFSTTLSLIQDKSSADYKKAEKEFEQFKKKANEAKTPVKDSVLNQKDTQPSQADQLSVPTPIPSGSQSITLPNSAQPPITGAPKEATGGAK